MTECMYVCVRTYESQPAVRWFIRRTGSRMEAGEKMDAAAAAFCLHLPETLDQRTSVFSPVLF